jgi:hypothetical protein
MTSAAKPTKGLCVVKFRKDDSCYISIGDPVNGPHKQFDMPFERSYANDEADAMLIEETFNVYTETGLTPRELQGSLLQYVGCEAELRRQYRQLADERGEMLETLIAVREHLCWASPTEHKTYKQVLAIIAKIEGEKT